MEIFRNIYQLLSIYPLLRIVVHFIRAFPPPCTFERSHCDKHIHWRSEERQSWGERERERDREARGENAWISRRWGKGQQGKEDPYREGGLDPECRAWELDGRRPVNRRRTPPEERCGGLLSANPGQMIIISRDPKLQRDSERDGKRKIALTLLFCFSLLFSVSLLFPYFLKSSVIM